MTTYTPTAEDLRVLRRAAEYAGCEQRIAKEHATVVWRVDGACDPWEGDPLVGLDADILQRPYAADFEAALRERLVADGSMRGFIEFGYNSARAVVYSMHGDIRAGFPAGEFTHHSPLLALAYAAERAGAFDEEEA